MTAASIYERALGAEFAKLHPRIRQRFGFSSGDGVASIGEGVMERIWYNKWAAAPLWLGTARHIMFPKAGEGVPFTIANYAYEDAFGRETVTWSRRFRFPEGVRKFDATMIYSRQRRRIVDYLGTKQHLAVDLEMAASPHGGILIRSGEQRFYEGPLGFRFPDRLTGRAEVHEWYDDEAGRFRITVDVVNPLLGPVFRYGGWFRAATVPMAGRRVPGEAKPTREEYRE
ncbi:DUF4166 domain-containing protein [Paenibacillus sp. MWE-103]|uniref:DUF4166 domain-containing protein n=1 Tax=Paenibacillus artemisiicola TaxID=1172618 RepID=A0ABS3WCC3_9BACL|nr:DUF4166 domain-containing protein [Paenibacillus artemisiicola]MBO7745958.1 DUF4166 domain-containing protein [Paenibacillus artemisiicola]